MPSISPDGKEIVFSWQNDLWLAGIDGGTAKRLTIHPASDITPRWMPDGNQIAFTSNRYGTSDLFLINKDGSNLRRLTNDPGNETLFSVSYDGKTLFGGTSAWGRQNVFCVPSTGGEIIQLTNHIFEMQFFPTTSLDGTKIAYNLGGSGGNWRNPYKAGTDTAEIWVGKLGTPVTENKQLTKNEWNDTAPMIAPNGDIYFISNRTGTPQLWSMNGNGGNTVQLTKHLGGTVRWPNMSASGKTIAYEYDSDIWIYDVSTKKTKQIAFEAPDDRPVNPTIEVNLASMVSNFVASPDGKRAIVSARGDLYLVAEKGGLGRRLTTHLAIDADPVWIGNDKIVFVSGRNTVRELWQVTLDGKESVFLKSDKDLVNPVLSPDGKSIAVHQGDREIVIVPSSGGSAKVVVVAAFPGIYAQPPSFSWSPDSKWLAYEAVTERGSSMMVVELSTLKTSVIARIAKGGSRPYWHPNGKLIGFTANDLATPRISFIDLVHPEVTFIEDDLDKLDEPKHAISPVEVKIQFEDIDRRERTALTDATLLGFTNDGKSAIVLTAAGVGSMAIRGGTPTPVAGLIGDPTSISYSDSKTYVTAGGKAFAVAGGQAAPIGFSATITVDRQLEDVELFKEIWWAMDRMYYDPEHHGKDWPRKKLEYAELVPFCFDRADFYALMNEMIEELDSSHLVISAGASAVQLERESIGWLGLDWDMGQLMSNKRYIVSKVLLGGPAAHPSSKLNPGDEIVSVDGNGFGTKTLTQMLTGKSDRKVRLGVKRMGTTEVSVVTIKPISPIAGTALRYDDFVKWRRAEAERLSGGKFTYFHLSAMSTAATDQFMNDIRTIGEGKQGAVIDVRWNGGGNTANRMLSALRGTPWLHRYFRAMPNVKITEEQMRGNALEVPSVLMTNQYSASNAEIFSEGYRRMKIGKIVGEATGGNVLTVSGLYPLWDGGGVQIPFIGVNTIDGESLEGIGRRTDIDVRFDPNAWNAGRDNQLEEAIKALARQVKN